METLSGTTISNQPSSEEMARFLKGLRRLVLDEAATVRQNVQKVWSKPLAVRVSEGRAIEGLRVVDVRPNGFIKMSCDRNSSRFREGDIPCLNRGNPFAEPSDMVTQPLYYLSDRRHVIEMLDQKTPRSRAERLSKRKNT